MIRTIFMPRSLLLLVKEHFTLLIILLLAFLIRVWRIDELLGFYYDQGRDAKIIWDLWHNGRFFLIGTIG